MITIPNVFIEMNMINNNNTIMGSYTHVRAFLLTLVVKGSRSDLKQFSCVFLSELTCGLFSGSFVLV